MFVLNIVALGVLREHKSSAFEWTSIDKGHIKGKKIEQLLLQSNTRAFKTFILLNFLNLNMMGYGRKLQIISLSEKSALLLLLHTIFFNDNCNMISYILQSIHFIREKNRVDFVGFNQ